MEGGPSSRFPGSETESEAAALGKDYWVRRTGEVTACVYDGIMGVFVHIKILMFCHGKVRNVGCQK